MKFRYILALLLLHSCSHTEDVSGKSVFVDMNNFDLYGTTGYALIVNQQHEKGHVLNKPEFSTTVFGGKTSTSGQEGLREYFLFEGKSQLTVNEDEPSPIQSELAFDILSRDFNIETTGNVHQSTITFNPEQKRLGCMFSLRLPFHEKYWFNVDLPLLRVKQDLGLEETLAAARGTVTGIPFVDSTIKVDSMYEAFRQAGLKYGRINGSQDKYGLADLTVRIGRNAYNREDLFVSQYLGLIIPTGNKRTAEYMWEPIVGNGHHAGIDWGNTTQICIHESSRCNWWATNALTGQYLFENTQKRSLDLHNGPWTRYLNMFADSAARAADARSFGINLMTKDVKVSPGASLGMASQLSMVAKNWNVNVGFMNRFRQAEEIELAEEWVQGPQIAEVETANSVSPARKMGRGYDEANMVSATDYFIKSSDINLNSAAHPNVFVSTLHASVAYFKDAEKSQNYELGGSYDTSRQNTAIDRWNLYGKLLINF